ncbi:phiSA1p31-related protein [Streptomyces sp. NPDC001515]
MTTVIIPAIVEAAGITYDLSHDLIDVYGCRWTWTGGTDSTGMALMRTGDDPAQRLTYVYWTYGPLIPAPRPITYADRYAALTAPSCAAPAEPATAEPTPLTFAGLLARLRGRTS